MSNYRDLIDKLRLNKSKESQANSVFLARAIHWYLGTRNSGIGYSKFLTSMTTFTKLPMESSGTIDFSLLSINQAQQYKAILSLDTAMFQLAVKVGMKNKLSLDILTNQAHWLLQTLRLMTIANQENLATELNRIIYARLSNTSPSLEATIP